MNNNDKLVPAFAITCGLIAVVVYGYTNLGYPGLWWDETAQFWISQGIDHYADPWTSPRGLSEALRLNRIQNLDPGGFTLLMHYWSRVSREVEWIRTLPFAFLLLLMLFTGLSGWRTTGSRLMATLGFLLPLAYPGILYFGLETRAYSMEMAGVACGLFLLFRALDRGSHGAFLLLGLVIALFLGSRYSYAFFVVTAFVVLLYCKPAGWGRGILPYAGRVALFAIPVAITAWVVFLYMTRYQFTSGAFAGGTVGLSAPAYTHGSVLSGNENYTQLLYRNTLSWAALPISLAIVYYLFLQNPLHQWLIRRYPAVRFDYRLTAIFVFVLVFQAISLVVSYFGFYPWDIGTRWSAYLLPVSMIAVLALLAEARMMYRACREAGDERAESSGIPVLTAKVSILLFAGIVSIHTATYRLSATTPWTDLSRQLAQLHDLEPVREKVLVTRYAVPAVRFFYEYGSFKGKSGYPSMFVFESEEQWRRQTPFIAADRNIGYVVTRIEQESLQERFPADRLEKAADGERPLLVIGPRDETNR